MHKAIILALLLLGVVEATCTAHAVQVAEIANHTTKQKTFAFKIKTQNGGIIGNIRFQADNVFEAIQKLMKRYPNCTILSAEEK